MDFWLSDDERDLQEGIRSFVDGRFPLEEIAEREETDAVIDPDRWREIAEMGVFSLRVDGFDNRSAVVAFEELGRGLVPGPIVATHIAAGLIDGAADGSAIVTLLETEATATLLDHAGQATDVLRLVDGRAERVDPGALSLVAIERPLDTLTPVWRVDGDVPSGADLSASAGADASAMRLAGTLLTAAQLVGVAAGAVELATAYAKEREQFGRPIGAFQAVKHLLAEMYTKTDVARSAVYAAACALDGAADDDVERAVAVAKLMAGEAALFGGKTGIQVHGGMGFTWEVHAQRFWKRAVSLDATFGTAEHHAMRMADMIDVRSGA